MESYDGWGAATATSSAGAGPGVREDRRHDQRRWPDSILGVARGLTNRTEMYGSGGSISSCTFRIERYDEAGNRLAPVAVQMKGIGFDGAIGDGEVVEARGKMKGGTLVCRDVYSHDSGSFLRVKFSYETMKKVAMAGAVALLVMFVVVVSAMAGLIGGAEVPEVPFTPASQPGESVPPGAEGAPPTLPPAPPPVDLGGTFDGFREQCLADGFDPEFCNTIPNGG